MSTHNNDGVPDRQIFDSAKRIVANKVENMWPKEPELTIRWCAVSEGAIEPKLAHGTDACFDLFAPRNIEPRLIRSHERALFSTGIAMEIPPGWEGVVRGRSGMFTKRGAIVPEGTIDAGYRGVIGVMMYNSDKLSQVISGGDAIGQIGFRRVPRVRLVKVASRKELNESERGEGGFGSTGRAGARSKE